MHQKIYIDTTPPVAVTISRTYDSVRAQADWGIEEETLFRNIFSFIDFGDPFFNLVADLVAKRIDLR